MRTYATILCLLLTVPALAVDTLQVTTPDPVLEAWRWTEFDRSNGLIGRVRDVHEDRDGAIWFATDRGVNRYSGYGWTSYSPPYRLTGVSAVYQTRNGQMWFGTSREGVHRLDPEVNEWTTYTRQEGLGSNFVSRSALMQARDGTLWVGHRRSSSASDGTETAISRFDGQSWSTLSFPIGPPNPSVRDILQATDGSIWVTTTEGLLSFDGMDWERYTAEDGLPRNSAYQILEARNGDFWFAFGSAGIARFDGRAWTVYRDGEDLLGGGSIWSLWQTADGAIWAGGSPDRLYVFRDGKWSTDAFSLFARSSKRLSGQSTRDGTMWVFAGDRAWRFDATSGRWTVYNGVPPPPTNRNLELASDFAFATGEDLWFGVEDGAVRYDGESWMHYTVEDGLIEGHVSTVLEGKDGAIWVAGQHLGQSGAARFDGVTWRVFSQEDGLVGKNIHTGFVADNGDMWFGTKFRSQWGSAHGAIRFDGESWMVYTEEGGLIHNMIYDIVQTPDGAIWFATLRGLSRFDGQTWTSFTPAEGGARSQKISSLGVDQRGVLWIGHGEQAEGVTSFDGESWTRHTSGFRLINSVWKIYAAQNGVLWFGTNGGLVRFDGSAWFGFRPDELPLPPVTAIHGITESTDGSIWLRSFGSGVLRMKPDRTPPGTALEPVSKEISSAGNLQLKWTGGDLWNETELEDLRYQWRLDDEVWAPASERTEITLTGMSSGQHTFEVRSVDKYSNVDPSPAVHAFIVEAPWWRNPAVAGPGLLLIIGILFQSARVVKGKQKLQESVDALSSANNELFQVNRDLESVNVDLQREQVLERLRGQAQGMQSSEDIGPVVEAVYRELRGLGLPLLSSAINIHLSETENKKWTTSEDGRVLEPYIQNSSGTGPVSQARRRGDEYWHSHREGEEAKEYLHRTIEGGNPRWQGIPEERWPQELDSYVVFFGKSGVVVSSEEPIAEEYLMLIKRFGEVFGYAHSRHQKLQQKEAQNRRLVVEAAVQHLRAEVQSMDEASDFERILSLLTESLKTVELTFDGCGIDVLDEPVEHPTMEYFRDVGFRYTAYRLDPQGTVTAESPHVPAPFPDVIQQTIERFIAGEPWQGTSEGQAIVEVPAGAYGRLRLTASERDSFTEDEVATLREFADAVALGYARYLGHPRNPIEHGAQIGVPRVDVA